LGDCENAGSKKQIVVSEGAEFVLPSQKLVASIVLSGALLGVLLLSVLGYTGCSKQNANNNSKVSPTPPSPSQENCKGMPIQKNVLANIMRRGYLIMGVQSSAPPMNDSPDSETDWEAVTNNQMSEEERRRKELSWKRTGFDYEIATMIAANMGLIGKGKVKAREVQEFKDLFCLLNRHEADGTPSVDIIMSGIVQDESYNDVISWSIGYADFGYALITKKSSNIESLDDCKDKKIGIVKGDNVVKKYVSTQLPSANIVELSDESDEWLFDGLSRNQVDAVVYDYPFAAVEVDRINDQLKEQGVSGKSLEIRDPRLPNSELKYCIGVPKGNDDLLEELNGAITSVKESPRYAALIQKYFSSKAIARVKIEAGANIYIVKRGDSLSTIARDVLNDIGRWQEIANLNKVANVHLIHPGQKLQMPK
jgi:ABC-type amino acid transport substrate-binding protein